VAGADSRERIKICRSLQPTLHREMKLLQMSVGMKSSYKDTQRLRVIHQLLWPCRFKKNKSGFPLLAPFFLLNKVASSRGCLPAGGHQ